jgi:hypothetical protein
LNVDAAITVSVPAVSLSVAIGVNGDVGVVVALNAPRYCLGQKYKIILNRC